MTMREAIAMVDGALQPGAERVTCPVCGQLVELLKRKLHTGMCLKLAKLVRWDKQNPREFMHYKKLERGPGGRDYPFLAYPGWKLIEPDGTRRGFWRITDDGLAFVTQAVRVPKGIFTYNHQTWTETKGTTSMVSALGDKFDLDELLSDNWPE